MTDAKLRHAGVWKTSSAFLRVDFIEEINYPATLVLRVLGVIAPLVPFFFISELVGNSPTVGGDYLTYVVIGLAMMTMLTGAMAGFGGALQNAFQRGTLETFLVEPVPWTTLPLAMNQWQILFGIVSALLVIGVGILLGAEIVFANLAPALAIGVLGVISAAAIGIVSAAVLLLTLKSAPVLRLYTLVASLLAGSIFSVSQLPSWAQQLSLLLPHTYVINGMRTVLMADPGTFEMSTSTAILALAVFDVVMLPSGLLLFRRALEFSRKMGNLGGY